MRRCRRGRHATGDRGQVLAVAAAGLAAFIMLVSLTIDGGYAFWAKRSLQSSADAAALAGAQALPDAAAATNVAMEYSGNASPAGRNHAGPLDTVTTVTCANAAGCPNKIVVEEHATVPTFFARLFGIDDYEVTARAVATKQSTPGAPMAIYAHEPCSGASGKGIIVNGNNADIDGLIHSNGNFLVNGSNFQSFTATIHRPQSGCSTVFNPSQVNFGPPSPKAPVSEPTARDWPRYFTRSEFTCDYTWVEKTYNTFGETIPPGVHCASKVWKIDGNNISGNVTVLAPEISINGNSLNLQAHTLGVPFFNVNLDGSLSSKEIVLNSANYTWTGYVFNPGGGIKVNGAPAMAFHGFLQALWVEVNLPDFRMTGNFFTGGTSSTIALTE